MMNKTNAFSAIVAATLLIGQPISAQEVKNPWGDQGNGTYINPILNADYSDPDVIRVGEKYYMVASDFHFMGMQVLESDDMVNWRLISQIYDHFDHEDWNKNLRYGKGAWAPSLRYHDGKFWMFVCTPHELVMSTATQAAGPWSPLHVVKDIERWEDPCPFWDEDGKAYLGHSVHGAGPIIIHRMSPDGKKLLDDGVTIYTGPIAEGTKFHKRNGYYYLSIPEGGVSMGWQTILRSKNIYGPYEKKVVLEQGSTTINGPHQGSLVDTPEGEWWFFHFQWTNPLGRVVHLQPASWKDDWPVVGVDIDMNGIGEPVYTWRKPKTHKQSAPSVPQTDDEFNQSALGLQWQFNHNPDPERWSLTERKGYLTIHPSKSAEMKFARNMVTQKIMGYASEATTTLDCSGFKDGQVGGLFLFGNTFNGVGVKMENGKRYLYVEKDNKQEVILPLRQKTVYLRVQLDALKNKHQFYYSLNNKDFKPCAEPFRVFNAFWKGARVGVYTYNTLSTEGRADFNWFHYQVDMAKK